MITARNILNGLLLLTAGAILLVGCVRDDRSDCRYPLPLRFTYTYNVEQTDLFDAEVTQLDLFLYDAASGRLVAQLSPDVDMLSPDNGLEWMVPPGEYDIVAWGGVVQRYRFSSMQSFEQALMSIRREQDGETVSQQQEHLFHAVCRDVRVTGNLLPEVVMDLHKNSNDVRIEITGLTETQHEQVACSIRSANGDYAFDNTIRTQQPVTYLPEAGYTNGVASYDHTVLGLWPEDDSWLKVELLSTPVKSDGTAQTLFDGSLSELLLQKPGTNLDLEDEFTIRLEVKPSSSDSSVRVELYVNDWHVVDMNGGLG